MSTVVVFSAPDEIAVVYRISQNFMDNALRDFPTVLTVSEPLGLDFLFNF